MKQLIQELNELIQNKLLIEISTLDYEPNVLFNCGCY